MSNDEAAVGGGGGAEKGPAAEDEVEFARKPVREVGLPGRSMIELSLGQ